MQERTTCEKVKAAALKTLPPDSNIGDLVQSKVKSRSGRNGGRGKDSKDKDNNICLEAVVAKETIGAVFDKATSDGDDH